MIKIYKQFCFGVRVFLVNETPTRKAPTSLSDLGLKHLLPKNESDVQRALMEQR